MISPDTLRQLKEACEKATKGPWTMGRWETEVATTGWSILDSAGKPLIETDGPSQDCLHVKNEDAHFIILARQYIPLLIEEVERLNGVIKELEPAYVLQEIRAGNATCVKCKENPTNCVCTHT